MFYNQFFIFITMNTNAIGIFDSGVGGISIWEEINQLLPYEATVYLADSKNAPYGERSKDEILQLCIKNTERLLLASCKIIVVACNTATTNAITYLRNNYNVPFIGIEPAVKPAALKSETGAIGILATRGTLSSNLFTQTAATYTKNLKVIEQYGDGLVELIEEGKITTPEMENLLIKYLSPMIAQNIDHLVLGCTHYPFLVPQIKKILPSTVTIIDSAKPVAKQTKNILITHNLLNLDTVIPTYTFFTNTSKRILQNFIDTNISTAVCVEEDF